MKEEQLYELVKFICEGTDLQISDFYETKNQLNTFGALTISLVLISFANKILNILEDIKNNSKNI